MKAEDLTPEQKARLMRAIKKVVSSGKAIEITPEEKKENQKPIKKNS